MESGCRFLGLLHMEVFMQRLEQEHGAAVITTTPTVPYTLEVVGEGDVEIENPAQYPLNTKVGAVWEPTVAATILSPVSYTGALMQLCQDRRGELTEHSVLGETRALLRFWPRISSPIWFLSLPTIALRPSAGMAACCLSCPDCSVDCDEDWEGGRGILW